MRRLRMFAVTVLAAYAASVSAHVMPQATAPPSLVGTEWTLTALGNQTVSSADSEHTPTLKLENEPPRYSGLGGCNRFAGTYHLEGETLSFGPAAETRMACPSGMEVEASFMNALSTVKSWRVVADALELRDARDVVVAHFIVAPKAKGATGASGSQPGTR